MVFPANLKAVPRLMMLHIESLDYFNMLVFFPNTYSFTISVL